MVVLTSLGPPEEGIRHTQPSTSVYINARPLGKGTLYVSESRVSWVGESVNGSNNNENRSFSLEYPHIALHAVSKDLSSFPHECLYLMIDVRLLESEATPSASSNDEDEDEGDESLGGMTEVRFVPEDKTQLEAMFQAMSECQALHPDEEGAEEDSNGEEEEEEDGGGGDNDDDDQGGMYDDAEEEPMDL